MRYQIVSKIHLTQFLQEEKDVLSFNMFIVSLFKLI